MTGVSIDSLTALAARFYELMQEHKSMGWAPDGRDRSTGYPNYVRVRCSCGWEARRLDINDYYVSTKAMQRHHAEVLAQAAIGGCA